MHTADDELAMTIPQVFYENSQAKKLRKLHYSTAKAEQKYFPICGGKAKRVDAASVIEAASVCGGKSHFSEACRNLRHDAESMGIMK
ncbi:hypothetical protein DPMN_162277 [Dreissena polymorpha]|uniref:Uncharacterized protein n=1 Tax=Dreissena polymorpha TaxID=45954 RepID=A0A9D4IU65_DREPO|nr:hypothetical protein DPMN_162277 [Dreissena polymorpha]